MTQERRVPSPIQKMFTLVNLNSILTEVVARLRPIVGDTLVVRTRFDPNLALISANPKQIDWLFVNLAADAYDGMPDGGELIITTANVELKPGSPREINLPSGQYVRVELSLASGRLEVSPTVRNMIQRIRGAVAVRGTSGSGIMVDVLLPRAAETASPVEQQHRLDGSAPIVLLVSGDSATRGLASDLLRGAGYQVVEAVNRMAAEEALASGEVNLMITDIALPEQDGLETILSIRAIYPRLKIIAIADETGRQLRTAKLFGADSVMSKPLIGGILHHAVRDQIG